MNVTRVTDGTRATRRQDDRCLRHLDARNGKRNKSQEAPGAFSFKYWSLAKTSSSSLAGLHGFGIGLSFLFPMFQEPCCWLQSFSLLSHPLSHIPCHIVSPPLLTILSLPQFHSSHVLPFSFSSRTFPSVLPFLFASLWMKLMVGGGELFCDCECLFICGFQSSFLPLFFSSFVLDLCCKSASCNWFTNSCNEEMDMLR